MIRGGLIISFEDGSHGSLNNIHPHLCWVFCESTCDYMPMLKKKKKKKLLVPLSLLFNPTVSSSFSSSNPNHVLIEFSS